MIFNISNAVIDFCAVFYTFVTTSFVYVFSLYFLYSLVVLVLGLIEEQIMCRCDGAHLVNNQQHSLKPEMTLISKMCSFFLYTECRQYQCLEETSMNNSIHCLLVLCFSFFFHSQNRSNLDISEDGPIWIQPSTRLYLGNTTRINRSTRRIKQVNRNKRFSPVILTIFIRCSSCLFTS